MFSPYDSKYVFGDPAQFSPEEAPCQVCNERMTKWRKAPGVVPEQVRAADAVSAASTLGQLKKQVIVMPCCMGAMHRVCLCRVFMKSNNCFLCEKKQDPAFIAKVLAGVPEDFATIPFSKSFEDVLISESKEDEAEDLMRQFQQQHSRAMVDEGSPENMSARLALQDTFLDYLGVGRSNELEDV